MKKIFLLIILLCATMGHADDLFVISDIYVRKSAPTTLEARTLAVQEGQNKAFAQLIEQLVPFQYIETIALPQNVQPMVSDFSVDNEKSTATQYMGNLTIRFKGEKVRAFLRDKNVPFLTQLPAPVIILPIFKINNQILPFNTSNILYTNFYNQGLEGGIFNFIVPNLDDLFAAGFDANFIKESSQINKSYLQKKYGIQQIVAVVIDKTGSVYTTKTYALDKSATDLADISLTLFDDRVELDTIFTDLKSNLITSLTLKWHTLHQEQAIDKVHYKAITTINNLQQLANFERKIKSLSFLESAQIRAFFNHQLIIDMAYKGTLYELEQKLKLSKLYLSTTPFIGQDDNAIYLLSTSAPVMPQTSTFNSDITQQSSPYAQEKL